MSNDFKKVSWKINDRNFECRIRNVGKLNPEAQIQISAEVWEDGKRSKFVSLDVPSDKVEEFMEALQ